MKNLLVEYIPFIVHPEAIVESINQDGRLIVKGVLQRAVAKNHNGRSYPKELLVREVNKYRQKILEKRAYGELDHPESAVVNLRNVSHNILDIDWSGDDVVGSVEILPTPSGNILKELLKRDLTVGISSRGVGSVKEIYEENGEQTLEVQDDFELIAFDFVSDPSTHGAFMKPVTLGENKDYLQSVNNYKKINGLITDLICTFNGECQL